MKDITSLCKRVICIHNGSISYDGNLDKLLDKLSPVKEILLVCRSEEDAIKLENSGFSIKNKNKNEITIKIENKTITSSLGSIPPRPLEEEEESESNISIKAYQRTKNPKNFKNALWLNLSK